MTKVPTFRLVLLALLLGGWIASAPMARAQGQQPTDEQLWEAFGHYVLVAQPEQAMAIWMTLSDRVSDARLLEIEESTPEYAFERFRSFVMGNDDLAEIGREIERRLIAAKLERAGDLEEIRRAIARLGEGQRPNMIGTRFLVTSGQSAVPAILETLTNERERELHPFLTRALIDMGRPVVYPLSVALPHLDTVHQIRVAQILGELGFSDSLPYLAEAIQSESTSQAAREAMEVTFAMVMRRNRLTAELTPAQWFLWQAERFYRAGTLGQTVDGFEPLAEHGKVWFYREGAGLIGVIVPPHIHSDVRAMFAAGNALRLDGNLSRAVTVLLASNSRRHIRLDGGSDQSYPFDQPAAFYLRLGGPAHQLPVLHTAIQDGDIDLATFAIAALADTGSLSNLLGADSNVRPLLMAINHPNRRLRFDAALAIAGTFPRARFEQSYRVVPVLAEAVGQAGRRHALVIAQDEQALNQLVSAVTAHEDGVGIVRGPSIRDLTTELTKVPGVDLVVVRGDSAFVAAAFNDAGADMRLAATPIVAVTTQLDWAELTNRYGEATRMVYVDSERPEFAANLAAGIDRANEIGQIGAIDADEATRYAVEALTALREIALAANSIFDVTDAQPAILNALRDERPAVARAAAQVGAVVLNAEVQRALAGVALDDSFSESRRIIMLSALAESANRSSNFLPNVQMHRLRQLVETATGDLAIEAARALGALNPPTMLLRETLQLGH